MEWGRGRERERERERERDWLIEIESLAYTAPLPTIGFDSSSNTNLFLREGESAQLCVVLLSGSILFEFTFVVRIDKFFEQPRGKSRLIYQYMYT